LQAKLTQAEEARKAHERQIADLRQATAECAQELLTMQQRAEGVGKAKDAEAERATALAAQAARHAEDNRALQRAVADTEASLRAAYDELADVTARLNRASDNAAALKDEAQRLRDAHAALERAARDRDAAHRAKSQADEEAIRALQSELAAAQAAGERALIEVKGNPFLFLPSVLTPNVRRACLFLLIG